MTAHMKGSHKGTHKTHTYTCVDLTESNQSHVDSARPGLGSHASQQREHLPSGLGAYQGALA